MSDRESRVTVVMITHNRHDEALRSLAHLSRLPERPPIVVVDNQSSDGTAAAIRREFPNVQLISAGRNLGGAARNLGVRSATSPYVAFCDDDCWWEAGSIRWAADVLDAHPKIAVMSARIMVQPQGREAPICRDLAASPLPQPENMPGTPLLGFIAGASIIRRRPFLDAGGFEERMLVGGEEELLALDLADSGWQIGYFPEIVSHHAPSNVRNVAKRNSRVVRNQLWVAWLRYPASLAWRRTVQTLHAARKEPAAAEGLAAALRGLPWALKRRRVISPEVERHLALLNDGLNGSSS